MGAVTPYKSKNKKKFGPVANIQVGGGTTFLRAVTKLQHYDTLLDYKQKDRPQPKSTKKQ